MKEYYDLLVSNNISPNGLFTLHCISENYQYNNYINFITEKHRLKLYGFLNDDGTLTNQAIKILSDTKEFLITKNKIKKSKYIFDDWKENIVKYNEMFPKGKREGSSISFRTNPRELFDAFKWFFATYPDYTWEGVFKCTDRYLSVFEQTLDYTYCCTSKYFIKKDDKNKNTTSILANMYYNYLEGNDEDINNGTYYFG